MNKTRLVLLFCMMLLILPILTVQSTVLTSTPLLQRSSTALILTSDYVTSSLSTVNTKEQTLLDADLVSSHGDDEIKYYNGHVYILNRFGYDSIDVFDANNNYAFVRTIDTGAGTNPYDIAFLSPEKAYVTLYDSTDLLIINPSTGEHIGAIDFSEFADADGIPEMHKMVAFTILGMKRVYVTVQRVNRSQFFAPTEESYIVELDGDNDEVIRSITLTGVNPTTAPIKRGKYIYVGVTGSWFDPTDGGIERVHLFTNEAEGFIITEEELEGNLADFDIYPKMNGVIDTLVAFAEHYLGFTLPVTNGYTLVSDMSYNTKLVSFDETTDEINTIISTEGWQLQDLAISPRGEVLIADRTFEQEGIRIVNAKTQEEVTSSPIITGNLPPLHITFKE